MDFMEAILTRRSIRKFTGEKITDGALQEVLKAGFHAPSAHNRQPWHFVVVRDRKKFEEIMAVHPYTKMLETADVCLVVCGDTKKQSEVGFLVEDCSAAIENMLIAVNGLGLGAVWCGVHPIKKLVNTVSQTVSLPAHILPIGLVVIGCKVEDRTVRDRFDESKIHYENW